MTTQGIMITDLRSEIQTLVNSDPKRYDPNNNGKIDDGEELSQLLSEYGCKTKDLTSDKHPKRLMLTYAEKESVSAVGGKVIVGGISTFIGIITTFAMEGSSALRAIGTGATVALVGLGIGAIIDFFEKKSNIRHLKAEQTEKANEIRQKQIKENEAKRQKAISDKEAELDAREVELNQREADFNSKVSKTSKEVEQNVNKANQKAKSLNKELDEIKEKTQNTEVQAE